MKPSIFVDTWYLIALLSARDQWHRSARALAHQMSELRASFLTTDAVLIELGDHFHQRGFHEATARMIATIRADARWKVLPLSPSLLLRAEARYGRHDDKDWSLTDCLSMEAMIEHRAKDVATADHHFAQAGFRVLMR